MAKLRKTLGGLEDGHVRPLMALIKTQSAATLTAWATAYVAQHYLPLTADPRLEAAVAAVQEGLPLPEAKKYLAEARKAAQSEKHPVTQAAARAVATGCAVLTTPTNALGFCFYGAAAYAYSTAGLGEKPEVYDALAHEELGRILSSLQAVAVENEPNPVKLNWNC